MATRSLCHTVFLRRAGCDCGVFCKVGMLGGDPYRDEKSFIPSIRLQPQCSLCE